MSFKVFIDGKAGTAGLELETLLSARDDINILEIIEEKRKDLDAKLEIARSADLTFLCLPDEAAREMASAADDDIRIIDTSTAHRVSDDWTYGLPEIGLRDQIRNASRVANPGCHATGVILGLRPLVEKGIIKADHPIAATSITGYSGGGKKMIADYEDADTIEALSSPGQYATGQTHKHLPEIKKYSLVEREPIFMPVVAAYYRGMATSVPLAGGPGVEYVKELFTSYYAGERQIIVDSPQGTIYANEMAGKNSVKIYVHGTDERTVITTVFDNLGKGAAGAAVQNMNIMLGINETKGL